MTRITERASLIRRHGGIPVDITFGPKRGWNIRHNP
jgi:hypothetical protein